MKLQATPDPDEIRRAEAIIRPWAMVTIAVAGAMLAWLIVGLLIVDPSGASAIPIAATFGFSAVVLVGLMIYVFNGPVRRADALSTAAEDAAYDAFNEQVKAEFGVLIPDDDLWVLFRDGQSLVFEAEKADGSSGVFSAVVTDNDLTVYEQQVKRASA